MSERKNNTNKSEKKMTDYERTLDNFVYYIQKLQTQSYRKIEIKKGRRYDKVYKVDVNEDGKRYSQSVHCFVEKETGNILKAASYKAPAKGVRGNIYDYESMSKAVSEYGAVYWYR